MKRLLMCVALFTTQLGCGGGGNTGSGPGASGAVKLEFTSPTENQVIPGGGLVSIAGTKKPNQGGIVVYTQDAEPIDLMEDLEDGDVAFSRWSNYFVRDVV
jgi:hypothetical protein